MPVRVKVCGITRLEDAQVAVREGAAALGFVFYEPSPRYIAPAQAAKIIESLPPFVTTTALFVNESADAVAAIAEQTQVDLLQFHGDESAAFCDAFDRPYIKAIRMRPNADLLAETEAFSSARALLLDAYKPGVPGGTGEAFNWDEIPLDLRHNIILAGGLTPENISQAIKQVAPYAVDVSGGVEASKGVKDPNKLARFFQEVARAENR